MCERQWLMIGFPVVSPRTPPRLYLSACTPPTIYLEFEWPKNLPWMQFQEKFFSRESRQYRDEVAVLRLTTFQDAVCRQQQLPQFGTSIFHLMNFWQLVIALLVPI